MTSQTVPTVAQNVYFDYDVPPADCVAGESFGAGRLASIRDESGSTRYCYDARGHRVRQVQTVTGGSTLTVGATFNAADRLVAMTYPSGAIVVYQRNSNGQTIGIAAQPSAGVAQVTLVSAATYLPFGPLTALTYGNGRVLTKTYDQNYGIDSVADSSATGISEDFSLDAVGNVSGLTESTAANTSVSRSYTYDGLDRLTAQMNGTSTVEGFAYNATGDRTSKTIGTWTLPYSYAAGSHRLILASGGQRSYDANGNTISSEGRTFSYDDRNRLRDAPPFRSYRHNGRGERVLMIDSATYPSRQFVYDEAGRLLGEYTLAGVRVKEYVWLDDTLIAILSSSDGSTYQYVETDHLGTPRAVVHPSKNTVIWRWNVNDTAFGEHFASGDPDGDSKYYELNLRFPGQYYDQRARLTYNYFRDYDPVTGRYIQSDPIGLAGGMSTYGYVGGRPLNAIDPYGLEVELPLFNTDVPNQFNTNAAAFVSPATVYTVAGHGNSVIMKGPNGEILRVRDVYEMIIHDKDFAGKKSVLLLSCETGKNGNNSFAQRLADALGVPVVAPDNYLLFRENGRGFYPGSVDKSLRYSPGTTGNWIKFSPRKPLW